MSFDFSGKTVFVAGGTSGINFGIANSFAAAGASLFVMSRTQDKVDAAIEALAKHGGTVGGCSADVRDMDAVKAAFAASHELIGDLDVLVSGAAGNFAAYANNISSNGFRAVMEIDVLGTHHVMTASWPYLKKPGASVINITAAQSYVPMVGQVHVCAAKAGVDQITRTLAMEWGPAGVRVNSVAPGPIANSEGWERLYPTQADRDAKVASLPLRRVGTHEDMGNVCLFLASDMAGYVTGALLPADGGAALTATPTRLETVLGPLPS